jgi:hypothetical protein
MLTRESGLFREVFSRSGNVVVYVKYYGEQIMANVAGAVDGFMLNLLH